MTTPERTLPREDPCSGWFCPECDHSRYCAKLHQRVVGGEEVLVSADDLRLALDVVRQTATADDAQDASRRLRSVLRRREIQDQVKARVRQIRLEMARENGR